MICGESAKVRIGMRNSRYLANRRFHARYVLRRGGAQGSARARLWLGGVCSFLALAVTCLGQSMPPKGASPSPAEDSSELFRQVIVNQKRLDADLNQYQRIERVEIRKTGSEPNPSEIKVWRVFPAGTGVDKIPFTKDDKPANAESYREALEKLETALVWAAQDGPAQKEAYGKVERRLKERNELIDATRKAFVFTRIGEEMRGNRVLVKYDMARNPDYKPETRTETLFTRVHGTIWIDQQSSELAKIEGRVTEDISLAMFLAKVYRGSYFMQERYEMAPGVWLPTYQQYDFDGRKFVIPFSIHERTLYSDYQRVGPPKEAVEVVRDELSKLKSDRGDP